MNLAPDTFLGATVPERLKAQWRTWEAAEWRKRQYLATNRLYPPDERFNVSMPKGMCERHYNNWLGYRNMIFDRETGYAWPGTPGSPFLFVGHNMNDLREARRADWDEKASERMQAVEEMCRGGRSNGCSRRRKTADVIPLPASSERAVVDLPLPAEAS